MDLSVNEAVCFWPLHNGIKNEECESTNENNNLAGGIAAKRIMDKRENPKRCCENDSDE